MMNLLETKMAIVFSAIAIFVSAIFVKPPKNKYISKTVFSLFSERP